MEIIRHSREGKTRAAGWGMRQQDLGRKASLQQAQSWSMERPSPQERRAGGAVWPDGEREGHPLLSPRETETPLKRDMESVYRGEKT